MAGAAIPPYALFVLSENIDNDYLNDVLRRTTEANDGRSVFIVVSIPDTSSPYSCGPPRCYVGVGDEQRILTTGGTTAVPDSYISPFLGKTLEDCAAYLSGTPEDITWETEYFCALDEHSKEDDTMMMIRILPNGRLHAFPRETKMAVLSMMTFLVDDFEQRLGVYQRMCRRQGKPDRSVGVPWTDR
ncbi:hypothetical protein F5Y11DRAFT_313888 [Daldinia sp. FL1419]|nr:hypothetical protein F5Y11DRAFT_313888 [Daldinia sp. FL1419]